MSTDPTPAATESSEPVKPLNMRFLAVHMLLLAVIIVALWHGLNRVGFQEQLSLATRTDVATLRHTINEAGQQQGRAISGITDSMTDFGTRLQSFESELSQARGQFELLDQLATERLAENALSRARVIQVRDLTDEVSANLDKLTQQMQRWNDRVTALLSSDSGQRLALSPDRLPLIDDLLTGNRVTDDDISGLRQQLQELRSPIDAVTDREDAVISIPEANVAALDALLAATTAAQQALTDDSGRLDSLLRQAVESPADDSPLLSDALALYRERRFDALNEEVRRRLDVARAASAEKIASAAEEAERARETAEIARIRLVSEAQLEADGIRGQIEAQRIRDAADNEQRAAEERQQSSQQLAGKRQRLRDYQAALPEVKRVLAAFVSNGHRQLNGTRWYFSDKAVPLSLSGIQARGALQNHEGGYQQFLWLAGGSDNDRPNGPFPDYIGGNIQQNHPSLVLPIRRCQMFLQKFGDLLVEEGLLAP